MSLDEEMVEYVPDEESVTDATSVISYDKGMKDGIGLGTTFNVKLKKVKSRRELMPMIARQYQDMQLKFQLVRRRYQQRRYRRLARIRSFYLQKFYEVETAFMQKLTVSHLNSLAQDNATNTNSTESNGDNSKGRFYEDKITTFTEENWLSNFRMRKHSFEWLCDQLQMLQPVGLNAPYKRLIPLGKRVALGLYALATGADYRDIARLFEVSAASVCKFVKRFAETLLEKWGKSLLAMPETEDEFKEITDSFRAVSKMPAVVGVLGMHEIPVNPSAENLQDYATQAGVPKVIMQLLIDDKMLFRKVQIDKKTPMLFTDIYNDISKIPPISVSGEKKVNCFVLTPSTYYQLRHWLMHEYNAPKEPHEHAFNAATKKIFEIRDEAMCRLLSRWQILQRKTDLEPGTMKVIALACCALHNLLEENDEPFEVDNKDRERFNSIQQLNPTDNATNDIGSQVALETRDLVAQLTSADNS